LIRLRGNHNTEGVSRPVDAVIEFLKSEQAHGKTHVFLDNEARDGLRELFIRARTPVAAQPAIAAETNAPRPTPQVTELTIEGADKPAKLESIKRQATNWAPALSLDSLRDTMVFSAGNPEAKIMFIGEAPGYYEEKEGQPFMGPAGQKLSDILKAMGITREEIYITYLVKFRPAIPKQTTNNRNPSPAEIHSCMPILQAEISVIQPTVIIVLGDSAIEGLLNIKGTIGSAASEWHDFSGIPTRATYHPVHLLKTGSNEVKRALWEDMLAVMEKLGMPISEKQKGFFLSKP
jgi:uracil-DNA glycosylase family 4